MANYRYFNPETNEIITHTELKLKFNASIPYEYKEFNGWHLILEETSIFPMEDDFSFYIQDGYSPVKITEDENEYTCYKPNYKKIDRDLETVRDTFLTKLKKTFNNLTERSHVKSSLGFIVDANEEANRNVQGIITMMTVTNTETITFCDYENKFHDLTLDEVKVLLMEIIANAQSLYQQKWVIRSAIENASSLEELQRIDISFSYMDFEPKETTE